MNIVFFGTSSFGIPALEALKKTHSVLAVVSTPDKAAGRRLQMQASPVKQWAQEQALPYFDYLREDPGLCLQSLKSVPAELFVVVSFGALLKADFLTQPRLYALNIHASLLPKYRGASPMQSALLSGEKETGVSVMRMMERLDAGDVLLQKRMIIQAEESRPDLEQRLSVLGAEAILEALKEIEHGTAKFIIQDELRATYAKKIKKEDGRIDWKLEASELDNRVRAFAGWPGSYFFVKGKRVLICGSQRFSGTHSVPEGTVLDASPGKGLCVACEKGSVLRLIQLQLEGRKSLPWAEFVKGFSLKAGDVLE